MLCSLSPEHSRRGPRDLGVALLLPIVIAVLASCATRPGPRTAESFSALQSQTTDHEIPVTRYGRYTLVEIAPTSEQDDLLAQVIDVTLPPTFSATVGDALRYVLLRSGYSLCTERETVGALEALPLPAAHLHIGPLTLRQALQVLAGRGWTLEVDDAARLVCYAPRGTSTAVTAPGRTP